MPQRLQAFEGSRSFGPFFCLDMGMIYTCQARARFACRGQGRESAVYIEGMSSIPCDAIEEGTDRECGKASVQFFRYTKEGGVVAFCEAHKFEHLESELTEDECERERLV